MSAVFWVSGLCGFWAACAVAVVCVIFRSCGAFFWGVRFGFLVCVAVFGGAWFAVWWPRVLGLFSSMMFDGHVWGVRGRVWGFSFSRWCLLQL